VFELFNATGKPWFSFYIESQDSFLTWCAPGLVLPQYTTVFKGPLILSKACIKKQHQFLSNCTALSLDAQVKIIQAL
jgi:hypothetical protein